MQTDREKLIELLNEVASNVIQFPTYGFIEALADHLLANGVTVKQYGRWIWSDFLDDNWRILCCSECFETEGARENTRYCPNCGAKMNLEE